MKVNYDSEAEALSIDLVEVDRWDSGESVDDTYCNVALRNGRLVNIELLNPQGRLDLLEIAAQRYGLDGTALVAAAQAALAAADRVVTVDVAPSLA
jgi:uncharacterized protein YuzE